MLKEHYMTHMLMRLFTAGVTYLSRCTIFVVYEQKWNRNLAVNYHESMTYVVFMRNRRKKMLKACTVVENDAFTPLVIATVTS